MATSTRWRLNVSANDGDTNVVGIGDWQLRAAAGVAQPFVRNGFTAAAANAGAATLGGRAALTAVVSAFENNTYHVLTLPFAVTFGGVSYTKLTVNSFGIISFGDTSVASGLSHGGMGNEPPNAPSIQHASNVSHSSFYRLYAGAENSNATFRIRLEMYASDTDPGTNAPDTIWEVTFTAASPNTVKIDFGTSAYGANLVAGLGDGYHGTYAASFGAGVVNQHYDVTTTTTTADGTATASTFASPGWYGLLNGPEQGCDNSAEYGWLTTPGTLTGWLQYEFTSARAVAEYTVTAPNSINYSDTLSMATAWTLEYWDGTAWQVFNTQTAQTGWGFGESRTYSILSAGGYAGGDLALSPLDVSASNIPLGTYVGVDAITLSPMTVAAAGISQQVSAIPATINGDATLSSIDLSGSLEPPLALELLALAATGVAGNTADGRMATMPMDMSGAMDGPVALPLLGVAAAGTAGTVGVFAGSTQPIDASGVMLPGTAGDGASQLELLAVTADFGLAGDVSLLPATLSAVALGGTASDGALAFEKVSIVATGGPVALPTVGDAQLSAPDSAGVMVGGAVSAGDIVLATMAATGAGLSDGALAGDSTLLPADAIASSLTGEVGTGAASLAGMTLSGVASAPPPVNTADGAALLLAADMTDGAMLAGPIGDGIAVTQALTLAATGLAENLMAGTSAFSLITLSAQSTLLTPGFADGAAALAPMDAAGTTITGNVADGVLGVPLMTLAADAYADTIGVGAVGLSALSTAGVMVFGGAPTDSTGDARLAVLQANADGLAETLATGAASLSPFGLGATAYADAVGSGNAALSLMVVSGTGYADGTAVGALLLQPADASATSVAGNTGSATLTIPLMQVGALGFEDAIGTATLSLPLLDMAASGIAGVASPVFVGVALNTHTRAVSTYDGLAFNSLTEFNGMVLAATASGIVALIGDTDNGLAIAAQVTGGISDFGAPQFKRVLAGYVGYRASGALDLTMITDEHHEYVYKLEPRRIAQIHASRVKFGRGVEGKYWQWKLANRDGADFALDGLALDVTALSRRIG